MSDTRRTESPLYKHKMNTGKHMRTSKQVYSVATQQGVCVATIATRRHNARKIKACSNACSNAERHHDHTKNVHGQQRRKSSTPDTLKDREKQYLACPPFGTPRFSTSTTVHFKLKKPLRCPPKSIKIRCCPPVLLSTEADYKQHLKL